MYIIDIVRYLAGFEHYCVIVQKKYYSQAKPLHAISRRNRITTPLFPDETRKRVRASG